MSLMQDDNSASYSRIFVDEMWQPSLEKELLKTKTLSLCLLFVCLFFLYLFSLRPFISLFNPFFKPVKQKSFGDLFKPRKKVGRGKGIKLRRSHSDYARGNQRQHSIQMDKSIKPIMIVESSSGDCIVITPKEIKANNRFKRTKVSNQ